MHRSACAALACLLLTAPTGCAQTADTSSSPASLSTADAPPAAAPSVLEGPNDAGMSPQPAPAMPAQDATSSTAAVDLAQRAMTAFARPTLDAATWSTELAPFLTPTARSAYVATDPAEVPPTTVTGPGRGEDSPSAFLAYVTVPTDVGDYRLLLSRESGDTGWLVETITAPNGVR